MGKEARRADPAADRGTRPRLTRAQRRDHLLDVAAELVVERGVGAVTMEGVAARAGVSKALPYTHFEDAGDLLVALRDREVDALTARVDDALGATKGSGFEVQVAAMVHAAVETARQRGHILTTLIFALPIANEPGAAVGDEPSQIAQFFADSAGLSMSTARIAAAIVVMGLTGGLLALSAGTANQETVETILTHIVVAGVPAVAEI